MEGGGDAQQEFKKFLSTVNEFSVAVVRCSKLVECVLQM